MGNLYGLALKLHKVSSAPSPFTGQGSHKGPPGSGREQRLSALDGGTYHVTTQGHNEIFCGSHPRKIQSVTKTQIEEQV